MWPTAAILNGIELGARPAQGQLVKVVRVIRETRR
jgi:hypothetical protein